MYSFDFLTCEYVHTLAIMEEPHGKRQPSDGLEEQQSLRPRDKHALVNLKQRDSCNIKRLFSSFVLI